MYFKTLLSFTLLLFTASLVAQDNRTYDGTGNNIGQPHWGAADTEQERISGTDYADGYSTPSGLNRPNPRVISNELFAQSGSLGDQLNLSDYIWVFGQFLDHDMVETENNPAEPAMIPVDFPDPYFNPGGAYDNVMIPMFRSMPAEGTGTAIGNPRQHLNKITSWIDGSGVYGSDETRALYLRSLQDGKMKTSTGNLLPWNTMDNEKASVLDPNAPHMADDVGFSYSLFVAGDVRANEQPLLTAFHTVFVREHNRQCDIIKAANPGWNDEEIYQHARKMVSGFIQSIVYNEYLPAMGVELDAYAGYNQTMNPSISNEFSSAAFRLGHTLLNSTILRMDNQGETIPEGNLSLANGFFNPAVVYDIGIDPYFKGMATQTEQELDCKMIDDVRNFLFGPPGSGGLDLAAININRGRERGIPDLNTMRSQLGLTAYDNFSDVNSDPDVFLEMENVYGNVFEIDAWVGMLAEEHMPGALFGETIMHIMHLQFTNLRDGDRFFYLNDDALSETEKLEIGMTTLHDIIMRNTDVQLMQENVFVATPHGDLCSAAGAVADITGSVTNVNGSLVSNVNFTSADMNGQVMGTTTASGGAFNISDLSTCQFYNLTGEVDNTDWRQGLSTLDLVLLARHLIGLTPITSVPLQLAGDCDGDNALTAFDLITIQQLILFITQEFPNGVPSWDLIPEELLTVNDPFATDVMSAMDYQLLDGDWEQDWIAFKMGDISGNDISPMMGNDGVVIEAFDREEIMINVADKNFKKGERVQLSFSADQLQTLYGLQGSFEFDNNKLAFLNNQADNGLMAEMTEDNVNWFWYQTTLDEVPTAHFEFNALQDGALSEAITWITDQVDPLAVNATLEETTAHYSFDTDTEYVAAVPFQLLQNRPNPAVSSTTISWTQPKAANIDLQIFDQNGRLVANEQISGFGGMNTFALNVTDLSAQGFLYYKINSPFGTQAQKMLVLAQ